MAERVIPNSSAASRKEPKRAAASKAVSARNGGNPRRDNSFHPSEIRQKPAKSFVAGFFHPGKVLMREFF
jgi:hypothetical protein